MNWMRYSNWKWHDIISNIKALMLFVGIFKQLDNDVYCFGHHVNDESIEIYMLYNNNYVINKHSLFVSVLLICFEMQFLSLLNSLCMHLCWCTIKCQCFAVSNMSCVILTFNLTLSKFANLQTICLELKFNECFSCKVKVGEADATWLKLLHQRSRFDCNALVLMPSS